MAVSSDGVLTVETRPYAAVGITINWRAKWPSGPDPWTTVVTRVVGTKTARVRSPDPVYTPGGYGYAQDNEPPLSTSVSYRADAYSGAGVLMGSSTTATVTTAGVSASADAWLKGVDNPHLSREVILAAPLGESWDQGAEVFYPQPAAGSSVAYPVVWQSAAQTAFRGRLRLRVGSSAEWDALYALLGSGVLLLQASSSCAVASRDLYLRRLGAQRDQPGGTAWTLGWIEVDVIEVDRPATTGSPLMVPGWSHDIRDAAYATYTLADAAYGTYNALAKGP